MATIEERAHIKYGCVVCGKEVTYNVSLGNAYIVGALEQRKIDVDKACAWLRAHLPRVLDKYYPEGINDIPDADVLNEDMREDFRKAMMED